MSKTIIGVVAKHNRETKKRPNTYIRDEVKQAIFDNDAIAIGILPTENKIKLCGNDWQDTLTEKEREDLIEQISLCDGIIIQDGTQNDEYENVISKYCYDNNIPILGICAGQNNIVRALGGTTFKVANPEKHNNTTDDYVHNIKINTVSGDINIGDIKANENASIEAVSGDIKIKNLKAQNVKIDEVSGDVTITNIDCSNIKMNSVSGDMDITGKSDNVKGNSISGDISFNNVKQNNLRDNLKNKFSKW